MKNRWLISCAIISTTLLLGCVLLFVYVLITNPNPPNHWPSVSIGHDFHCAVIKNWGCNLVCYNGYMPYMGNVVSIDNTSKIVVKGWNGFGIYVRLVKNPSVGTTWWTLMVSLWYPIAIFGMLSIVLVTKRSLDLTHRP
jgi:hypothetical protein